MYVNSEKTFRTDLSMALVLRWWERESAAQEEEVQKRVKVQWDSASVFEAELSAPHELFCC